MTFFNIDIYIKKLDTNVLIVILISCKNIFIDDVFFNRNWTGACWNRWAGPLALDLGLLCNNKKQRGSAEARPLPLRCLSQFFPMEENINCLGNKVCAYVCVPFTDGVAWYL